MSIDFSSTMRVFVIIYFVAIFFEVLYSSYYHKNIYDPRDTLVNFSLGILAVLLRVLTKGIWLSFWIFLYQYAPFKMPENTWTWGLLFLGNEFVYYWFHRLSHENHILWAVHVNHHSSEKMNFSNAARIPFLNIFLHNVFWIPLLMLGFNPTMIFAVETISFLFSFVQHTQIVGKLPIIDYVLNTPSHHRVHHASNVEYLNKNYGNVLIIFDRLFGTFKAEGDKSMTRFGLIENIHSHNLITVIFHEWIKIVKSIIKK